MNVLLTGVTGFLGSHLARGLLSDGRKVIALKRRTSNLWRIRDIYKYIHFHDLEGLDLTTPFNQHGPIDAVIHTATCYGRAGETPTEVFAANTAFPLRLLQAAAFYRTGIFFNTDTFFNTGTVLPAHLNHYSLSKRQFMEWGETLCDANPPKFVNIRLEHMYGPDDDPHKFTSWIMQQCIASVQSIDLTPGEQQRDFIHVADVVSAYQSLLDSERLIGKGFLQVGVGFGEPVTVRHFVEKVRELSSSKSQLNFGALPYREGEIMRSAASLEVLDNLGWQPSVPLEIGILSTLKFNDSRSSSLRQ